VLVPGASVVERGGGSGSLGDGRLPLGAVALEVVDDPQAEGVLDVETFDADEVTSDLGGTLTEADHPVVHGQGGCVDVVS